LAVGRVKNDRDMKKVLDSVTLAGHVFATLEKWASNPTSEQLL
jgi:hypothetical protein